jgi:endonuclease/exonuclease/phosphatase family metal-dependent hydrolase
VALISRLPAGGEAMVHHALPRGLAFTLPGQGQAITSFTRPVLHARLQLGSQRLLHLFVLHLKSQRPDHIDEEGNEAADAGGMALAMLRSLMRRGIDALGVRCLAADIARQEAAPLMVMGDFNDGIDAVTTRIAMSGAADGAARLYHCGRLQPAQDALTGLAYTHIHDGRHDTIDHVLVSEEFHPESEHAIAEAIEVSYLNEHVALPVPGASDHGAVLVRVRFKPAQG